jgi:hypothetical protein
LLHVELLTEIVTPRVEAPPVSPAINRKAIADQPLKQVQKFTLKKVGTPPLSGLMAADTEPTASANPQQDASLSPRAAPLNLSPRAMSRAIQATQISTLAEAARNQLGHGRPSEPQVFARHVASATLPDCLRDSLDGEGQVKPAPNSVGQVTVTGIAGIAVIAYAAATGKCR